MLILQENLMSLYSHLKYSHLIVYEYFMTTLIWRNGLFTKVCGKAQLQLITILSLHQPTVQVHPLLSNQLNTPNQPMTVMSGSVNLSTSWVWLVQEILFNIRRKVEVLNPTQPPLAHSFPDVQPTQVHESRHSWEGIGGEAGAMSEKCLD